VPQVGIINPSEMAPDKSLEAVVGAPWVGAAICLVPSSAPSAATHSRATLLTLRRAMALYPQRALYFRDVVHAEGNRRVAAQLAGLKGVF